MEWIIGLCSGTLGLFIVGGIAWVFRVDRKLTAVCTTVDLLFKEKNHHCTEQKEACKDKFDRHCSDCDRRMTSIEAEVKELFQKGG